MKECTGNSHIRELYNMQMTSLQLFCVIHYLFQICFLQLKAVFK